MKALTLTQPWATLISLGAKTIETRSWATKYRGPLAIHAAAGLGPVGGACGLHRLVTRAPFWDALGPAGYSPMRMPACGLPLGAIVAVCELVGCHPTVPEGYADHDPRGTRLVGVGEEERAFGDYAPGRYAWLLSDIRALPKPIPCKGALGLWELDTLIQLTLKSVQIAAL